MADPKTPSPLAAFEQVERWEPGYDDDSEMVTMDKYADGNWLRASEFLHLLAHAKALQEQLDRLQAAAVRLARRCEKAHIGNPADHTCQICYGHGSYAKVTHSSDCPAGQVLELK